MTLYGNSFSLSHTLTHNDTRRLIEGNTEHNNQKTPTISKLFVAPNIFKFHIIITFQILYSCGHEMNRKTFHPLVSTNFYPHRTIALAQLNPAPNPAMATVCPAFISPFLTASSSANGIDAADVLP